MRIRMKKLKKKCDDNDDHNIIDNDGDDYVNDDDDDYD